MIDVYKSIIKEISIMTTHKNNVPILTNCKKHKVSSCLKLPKIDVKWSQFIEINIWSYARTTCNEYNGKLYKTTQSLNHVSFFFFLFFFELKVPILAKIGSSNKENENFVCKTCCGDAGPNIYWALGLSEEAQ